MFSKDIVHMIMAHYESYVQLAILDVKTNRKARDALNVVFSTQLNWMQRFWSEKGETLTSTSSSSCSKGTENILKIKRKFVMQCFRTNTFWNSNDS